MKSRWNLLIGCFQYYRVGPSNSIVVQLASNDRYMKFHLFSMTTTALTTKYLLLYIPEPLAPQHQVPTSLVWSILPSNRTDHKNERTSDSEKNAHPAFQGSITTDSSLRNTRYLANQVRHSSFSPSPFSSRAVLLLSFSVTVDPGLPCPPRKQKCAGEKESAVKDRDG